jgi:hypothetical protein
MIRVFIAHSIDCSCRNPARGELTVKTRVTPPPLGRVMTGMSMAKHG